MSGKNRKKQLLNIILILFSALFIVFAGIYSVVNEDNADNFKIENQSDNLVITNLNVGKADAAFVEYNGYCGIIDTGTKDAYTTIKNYLKDNKKKTIDFMIITHYDKDHVGSAVKILRKYNVKKTYLPDYVSTKSGYKDLMDEIEDEDNVVFVDKDITLTKGDLDIKIIPPTNPDELLSDEDNMDNNMSLLTMITFRNKRFFFTGDIEKERINQILGSGEIIMANWIKIPHHGAYAENIGDLLNAVLPEYSVVSTGYEKPTDSKLLTILAEMNIQNYTTLNGTVITTCNGNEIEVRYLESE